LVAAKHIRAAPSSFRAWACKWARHTPRRLRIRRKSNPKSRASASVEVHDPTLLFVDFDLQLSEFLAQLFLHRRYQSVMSQVGVDASAVFKIS